MHSAEEITGVPKKLNSISHNYLARLDPTTFLYATDKRLRSSDVNSTPSLAIERIASTISSYRSACSAIFARKTLASLHDQKG
jgi:hypothetical protein